MKYLAIDFDGTCVTHEYPKIGADIGAVPTLRLLATKYRLILWTMRDGETLQEAVDWFENNLISLYGVNENPDQHWSKSPKAYANVYIDDAALGIPLTFDPEISGRPYVDWKAIEEMIKHGML